MDTNRRSYRDDKSDQPTHSRLFVVCDYGVEEQKLRDAFDQFGTIEYVRLPKDRNTGQHKGIAFIKFSKTSEAAKALEGMHSKIIPGTNRPLKIKVATDPSNIETEYDGEQYRRLFVTVPRCMNERELREYFGQFGAVDSVIIQHDRDTGESKGFGYITYRTFSDAAHAFEECEGKYRAIFAQSRQNKRPVTSFESNISALATNSVQGKASLISMMNVKPQGYSCVNFMCSPYLTHYHVEMLFDMVPGMIECQYTVDLMRNYGHGSVQYSNPVSAAYAFSKINNFEYPPGQRIQVKPFNSRHDNYFQKGYKQIPNAVKNLNNAIQCATSSAPNLEQLTQAIAEASKLIKMATGGVNDDTIPDTNDLNYCSVKLPPPQPLADIDSKAEKRCFLVCKPQPPPLTVLRDIFCRFGNLINVYTLPNKTVGYARYATVESADEAIKCLHGAEICGVRIKVLEAEDEAPPKRMRKEHTEYEDY